MHFSPPESMKERLEAEGIRVEKDQILDFPKIFWDPSTELSLA
jgi:methylated-DNA-protein-cysteine methyltransferase-like protein